MKFTNYIFLCIAAALLFSCIKKKEHPDIETNNNSVSDESADEKEAMKEFIYNNDQYFQETDAEIVFIEKANFGIPGGENWIVKLNSMHILIYVINGDKIEEDYYGTVSGQYFVDQYLDEISVYDIMRDIPGTHIPDGSFSFGDFNGDGIDEMFRYLYVHELGHNIDIFHYDPQKKEFMLCRIPYKIIDPNNGPAPVEFTTYKGMYGFKVYYSNFEVAEEQGWDPDPDPKNDKWIFYTWDAGHKKYIEVGEVVD